MILKTRPLLSQKKRKQPVTRILISAGGTGGGVYPALAVASVLRDHRLYFVSSAVGIENELIANAGFHFAAWDRVQGGPLHGVNLLIKVVSILRLSIGVLQALWILLHRRPQVVFMTGGWVSVPIAVGAWLYRIPSVIFVPDIEPAQTLTFLGRFAKVITATVEDTAKYYPAQKTIIATGYPLRAGLLGHSRAEALAHFGLAPDKQTLLVFGGSRGSRAINRAVYGHIEEILAISDLQVLHISGKLDADEVRTAHRQFAPEIQSRYHICDYVHEMGLAFAAADLVLCRAGASTLGEFPVFGLPAILVPLAYEWHYQEINADWLASRGAAIRLDEPDMEAKLVPTIRAIMQNDLEKMRQAARSLARTDGADNIARVILNQTKGDSG